jgi:4-amino-4-deoxy-L-arabinose transferase-like glycosyltransferase
VRNAVCIWIAAYGLLIGLTLDNTRPYKGDETYYTVSTISMVEEGNYLIPFYEGAPRFQKPPLAYWLVALGYEVFGIRLWSARLLFLILACTLLYLTYETTLLFTNDRENARFNTLLLASAPMTVVFSRIAMTDLPATFFLTATLYFFLRSLKRPNRLRSNYLLAYLCMGLALLAKGYIGLLPIPTMIFYLLVSGEPDRRRYLVTLLDPFCILTVLLVAAPWYIYVYAQYGPQLLTQSSMEYGKIAGIFSVSRYFDFLVYYLGVLVRYFFPFTLAAGILYYRKRPKMPSRSSLLLIFTIAVLAIFVFFVRDPRSRYLLVLFPSLTLLVGHVIYHTRWRNLAKRLAIGFFILQILVLVLVPIVSKEPVKTLVGYWRENLHGTIAVYALSERERGWAEIFSRGAITDTHEIADFVLTDSDTTPRFGGYRPVETVERIQGFRFESPLHPVLEKKTYFLLERPR